MGPKPIRFARLLALPVLSAGLLVGQPLPALAGASAQAEPQGFQVDAGIEANIHFVDNGPVNGLMVTGSASGFKRDGVYISLIYDSGSVAENVTAAGIGPCEPTLPPGQPGFLDGPKMFVGFWLPMGSTERKLSAVKTQSKNMTTVPPQFQPLVDPFTGEDLINANAFTPVGTFASISVRRLDAEFALHACGAVKANGKTARAEPEGFQVDAGIEAEINFVDNGPDQGLVVTGSGSGFQPNGTYISLIYDSGSVAENVSAGGFGPCDPTIPPGRPGSLDFPQMVVGFWLPQGSNERTLHAVKTRNGNTTALPPGFVPPPGPDPRVGNTYTPIGTFASVSVRRFDAFFELHACGAVGSDS